MVPASEPLSIVTAIFVKFTFRKFILYLSTRYHAFAKFSLISGKKVSGTRGDCSPGTGPAGRRTAGSEGEGGAGRGGRRRGAGTTGSGTPPPPPPPPPPLPPPLLPATAAALRPRRRHPCCPLVADRGAAVKRAKVRRSTGRRPPQGCDQRPMGESAMTQKVPNTVFDLISGQFA